MKTKLRALVGGVALLLVLAACYPGASSQVLLGYEVQATVTKGKINLNHSLMGTNGFIDPSGSQGPWYFPRSNVTSQASFDLTFSQTQGNWNVKGKWVDGFVKMEFAGRSEYLSALTAHCLSNVYMNDVDGQLWGWDFEGASGGYDFEAEDCGWFENELSPANPNLTYSKFIRGGCVNIPTMYRSLNPDYPGTGHALLLVCQNGNANNPITGSWQNPSYVEVWIPDTTWVSEQAIGDVDFYLNGDEDSNDVCGNLLEGYYVCNYSEDEYYFNVEFQDNVYYGRSYFENDNSPFRNYYAGGINTNRSGKWVVQVRFNELADSPLPTQAPLFSTVWYGMP